MIMNVRIVVKVHGEYITSNYALTDPTKLNLVLTVYKCAERLCTTSTFTHVSLRPSLARCCSKKDNVSTTSI